MIASRYSVDQSCFARGLHARIGLLHGGIAAHLAAGVEQHVDQRLQMRRRRRAIDQQGLGRAADAGAAHLGVQHDGLGHVERGRLVDIDVADAFEMREHRHARFGLHARDQALAAARHDDVDGAVEPCEHHADRGAVARRHQRDRVLGQVRFAQALRERGMDRARRAMAVRAAAQDHGVAGLERERAGVGGDVRPALVDHADDAERHAHALDRHAVRPRPGFGDLADRIGQARGPRRGRRPSPATRLSSSVEPVEERGVSARRLAVGHVLGIGGQDRGLAGADRRRPSPRAPGSSARPARAPARARRPSRRGRSRASSRRCRPILRWFSAVQSWRRRGYAHYDHFSGCSTFRGRLHPLGRPRCLAPQASRRGFAPEMASPGDGRPLRC